MKSQEMYALEHLVEGWCDGIAKIGRIACCVHERGSLRMKNKVRLFSVSDDQFDVYLDRQEFLDRYKNGNLREFIEHFIIAAVISGEL